MKTEGLVDLSKKKYTQDLTSFFNNGEGTTGLCYLRGRRRVGKSTTLKSLQQKMPILYFSGKADESSSSCLARFALDWSKYSRTDFLLKIKTESLSWELLFQQIAQFATAKRVMIAYDEIQWIAKSKSGMIGALKNEWLALEKTKNIRMVICGSSNKFFLDYTGGEEQILRGIKTRADIYVQPFSLKEIHEFYFPQFKKEEILFVYMLFGGIPYYLNQIPKNTNFIQAINEVLFSRESIFTEEVDEVLRLEFNSAGISTVKKILSTLGMRGKTLAEIQKKSRLATGTLTEAIEKLVDYRILFQALPYFSNAKEIRRGMRFNVRDFYLNTYFQIIKPNLSKIKRNFSQDLLINSAFNWPQSFYYVEGFSDEAFENLVQDILDHSVTRSEDIFKKLKLKNINFEVGTHWDPQLQIDLVLHDADDQQLRLLECKWTSSTDLIRQAIVGLPTKIKNIQFDTKPILAVIIPIKATVGLKRLADENKVILISQEDLM